jgi:dethiobiotin synthetase
VTLRDLAADLGAAALVVVSAELGTLNHTALTLEALGTQGIPCSGLVLGSWPRRPDVVQTSNRSALERLAPVRGELPAGAASLGAAEFAAMSAAAFDRHWVSAVVG